MNSAQLRCAIMQDKCLRTKVSGIYAADTLPLIHSGVYVVNTDTRDLPGEHWLVLTHSITGACEFYDTFARPPTAFRGNIPRVCKDYVYNKVKVQDSGSDTCGYHVLYYLLMICKGKTMHNITFALSRLSDPDVYVYDYVRKYFECNL